MTLVPNWRAVLKHAWSAYVLYIAGALSALEVFFQMMGDSLLGPRASAVVNGLLVGAALMARISAQSSFSGGANAGQ